MTADNDYNMVKPVDSTGNIAPLTEAEGKKQQKQKQRWKKQSKRNGPEQAPEQTAAPTDSGGENRHTIDYRA
jgi:hypothetical protein